MCTFRFQPFKRYLGVLILLGMAGNAHAVLYSSGLLDFETTGQSMWGEGVASGFDVSHFLGTTWNSPTAEIGGIAGSKDTVIIPGIPEITTKIYQPKIWIPTPTFSNPFKGHYTGCGCWKRVTIIPETDPITGDTRTGGVATARSWGTAGFNLGAKADSGSVDAQVSYGATLNLPDAVLVNEFFSLNPNSDLSNGSSFSTNSPEISAKAEAVLGAKAELGGQVCFIGFGCSPDEEVQTATVGFDTKTLELVSFNEDSSGQIKVLGALDPALFQFDSKIEINPAPGVNVGNVTVHVPDINTVGSVNGSKLESAGADDLLALKADLDGLIAAAFGLPSILGTSLNAGIFNASYDIIDIEYGPTLEILQNFELKPTLMVDLAFSSPVLVEGIGLTDFISSPWEALPRIALQDLLDVVVTPEFYVDALFSNNTTLGVDGEFLLSVLQASFSLEAFGLSLDIGEGLGPVFELSQRDDWFNLPPLFSEEFSLGDFNRILGPSFQLSAAGIGLVTEPGSLALLVLGVLLFRRNRSTPSISRAISG